MANQSGVRYVAACNAAKIGNIAAHNGISKDPFTMLVWPTGGRRAQRANHKNYGHAAEAFYKQKKDMEGVSKIQVYDNILHCLVKST